MLQMLSAILTLERTGRSAQWLEQNQQNQMEKEKTFKKSQASMRGHMRGVPGGRPVFAKGDPAYLDWLRQENPEAYSRRMQWESQMRAEAQLGHIPPSRLTDEGIRLPKPRHFGPPPPPKFPSP